MFGLYDQSGMLRYAGPGPAECLAYAELFGLAEGSFSLEPLLAAALGVAAQPPLPMPAGETVRAGSSPGLGGMTPASEAAA